MANLTFSGLEDVAEMVGFLKDLRVQVKRSGTGRQTRYSIIPVGTQTPPPEEPTDFSQLVDKIRSLCALAGMDAKQEINLFLTEVQPELKTKPADVQFRAFYEYIDKETRDLRHVDEPQPKEPTDISSYF